MICLGLLVMVGWMTNSAFLLSVLPGKISMKPNTALGFLAVGLAIWFLTREELTRRTRIIAGSLAGFVVAVGLITLVQYAFHVELGVDQLLFPDPAQFPYPGRMAHISAVNFCLAGLALVLLSISEKHSYWAQFLSLLTGLSSLLAIVGYVYGVPFRYGSIHYASMAPHTGIGFLILSAATLHCRPEQGLMKVVSSSCAGGWLSRRLIPIAVMFPVLLGALYVHNKFFLSDVRLALACLMITQTLLFVVLVWVSALWLNRAELEKTSATEALKRSEKQLLQSQKLEAVGLLAGGVAHDFNNLLGVITGYSELLLEKLPASEPERLKVEQIRQAGQSAVTLTRQLLMFSRKQVSQPVVLDLNRVISNLNGMLRRLVKENIRMTLALGTGLNQTLADAGQIEQIVLNLVVNACDAMPEGGELRIATANVTLDDHPEAQPGQYVMLEVSDNGTGMDQGILDRIFEPFFTTKEVGKGTGLGLATVYGIVKQSRGFVTVDSKLGKGTSFRIYFPVTERREVVLDADHHAAGFPAYGTTVLVVEDAPPLRSLICEVLQAHGFEVLVATEGKEALRICEQHKGPIHLLLTDVIMPGISGASLAKQVRTRRGETKCLLMSGYSGEQIESDRLNPYMGFIAKPFVPADLLRKINDLLHASSTEHHTPEAARGASAQ